MSISISLTLCVIAFTIDVRLHYDCLTKKLISSKVTSKQVDYTTSKLNVFNLCSMKTKRIIICASYEQAPN